MKRMLLLLRNQGNSVRANLPATKNAYRSQSSKDTEMMRRLGMKALMGILKESSELSSI